MKAIKYMTLIIFFLTINYLCKSADSDLKTQLKSADYFLIIVTTSGNCHNCQKAHFVTQDCIIKNKNKKVKIKPITLVRCGREKELKLYQKEFPEAKNICMFKPDYEKEFGFKSSSSFLVLDNKLNLIAEYSMEDIEKSNSQICSYLSQILQKPMKEKKKK
jgi:hypothetical protein